MTQKQILEQCRKWGWIAVQQRHGWLIVPTWMTYPQGVWSSTLKKAYRLCVDFCGEGS